MIKPYWKPGLRKMEKENERMKKIQLVAVVVLVVFVSVPLSLFARHDNEKFPF